MWKMYHKLKKNFGSFVTRKYEEGKRYGGKNITWKNIMWEMYHIKKKLIGNLVTRKYEEG